MYDYFLFDWDGCLYNSISVWIRAYKKTFELYGLYIPKRDIPVKIMGDKSAPIKLGLPQEKVDDFYAYVFEEYNNLISKKPLDSLFAPHAKETLKELKRLKKNICIVTSSWRSSVSPILKKSNVKKYIDFIISWEDVTCLKPNPEPILKAINTYKASFDKVIMVGDSSKDILAGKAAGISTVLYFPTYHKKIYSIERLKKLKPDYIFYSFIDLLSLI